MAEGAADDSALDSVVWSALAGPQARFAEVKGRAARFDPQVSPFTALADPADPAAWRDLADLVGPGAETLVAGRPVTPPAGWSTVATIAGVQLTGASATGASDPEAVPLGPADRAEVLDLVARTKPGPFRDRTIEMGAYLGVRRDGALIAMAGERLRVPGWTEVSAVCTDPAYRGQGLAARLIGAVVAGIRRRGDEPFLHAAGENINALRLYEHLGFVLRTEVVFGVYRSPRP